LSREGYGNVIPLGLGDEAFNSYMIYFSVIISALSLGVKIGIGAPSDYKDCDVSWESFILLLWLLDLWWSWRWWVGFGFNLRGSVAWRWVGDLRNYWGISYLWSWWRV
jgi:hypothetical protein